MRDLPAVPRPREQLPVPLFDGVVLAVRNDMGTIFLVLRDSCGTLGLDVTSQRRRILNDERLRTARFRIAIDNQLQARLARGFTVRAAASAAGLRDHAIIVRYENGQTVPPLHRIDLRARVYGVSPAARLVARDDTVALVTQLDTDLPVGIEQLIASLNP